LLEVPIGLRLVNREAEQRKITTIEVLPAIGLAGLTSSAVSPPAVPAASEAVTLRLLLRAFANG
jgi:hypothetical protein